MKKVKVTKGCKDCPFSYRWGYDLDITTCSQLNQEIEVDGLDGTKRYTIKHCKSFRALRNCPLVKGPIVVRALLESSSGK